ncbi:MAG: putative DNA-binding protein [Gammaproteobacteria bacterium]|jgi:predicted DNA-binding protein with PD1-like motif|nr:putative DNA-binding protein [Gammaproteobacteria bacterium]
MHLHVGVANTTGQTVGGQLMDGNIIYTTVEIAIVELPSRAFFRELASTYGHRELVVKNLS